MEFTPVPAFHCVGKWIRTVTASIKRIKRIKRGQVQRGVFKKKTWNGFSPNNKIPHSQLTTNSTDRQWSSKWSTWINWPRYLKWNPLYDIWFLSFWNKVSNIDYPNEYRTLIIYSNKEKKRYIYRNIEYTTYGTMYEVVAQEPCRG